VTGVHVRLAGPATVRVKLVAAMVRFPGIWTTTVQLAAIVMSRPPATRRALTHLEDEGLVEHVTTGLGNTRETRWRLLPDAHKYVVAGLHNIGDTDETRTDTSSAVQRDRIRR